MPNHQIVIEDTQLARGKYEINEPRDLFYRTAIELVELTLDNKTQLSLADSIAVLLQTWNAPFYKYFKFTNDHFSDIQVLLQQNREEIAFFRSKNIISLNQDDSTQVKQIFHSFELVLGPVGAAKSLHLLSPYFFALWDRAIAHAYVGNLEKEEQTQIYIGT